MINVLIPKELNIDEIQYSNPQSNIRGGQSIFITHKDQKLFIQTPKCVCEAGITNYTTSNGDTIQSLSLNLNTTTLSNELFSAFLKDLDEKNIQYAEKNSLRWFKKYLARDVVSSMYNNQVFNDSLKIKIPTKNGTFDGLVFDKNNKIVDMDHIQPGCIVQCVIECTGMYFLPSKFGMSWRAIQIKIQEPPMLKGYAFIDEKEEEEFTDVDPMV